MNKRQKKKKFKKQMRGLFVCYDEWPTAKALPNAVLTYLEKYKHVMVSSPLKATLQYACESGER